MLREKKGGLCLKFVVYLLIFFLQDSVVTNPAISLVCLHLLDVYNFAEYAYK